MVETKLYNPLELNEKGLSALKDSLGIIGTIRFLEQYDNGGFGDYTKEKYLDKTPEPTEEEIRKMFLSDTN